MGDFYHDLGDLLASCPWTLFPCHWGTFTMFMDDFTMSWNTVIMSRETIPYHMRFLPFYIIHVQCPWRWVSCPGEHLSCPYTLYHVLGDLYRVPRNYCWQLPVLLYMFHFQVYTYHVKENWFPAPTPLNSLINSSLKVVPAYRVIQSLDLSNV
jgi:hypothetical protein